MKSAQTPTCLKISGGKGQILASLRGNYSHTSSACKPGLTWRRHHPWTASEKGYNSVVCVWGWRCCQASTMSLLVLELCFNPFCFSLFCVNTPPSASLGHTLGYVFRRWRWTDALSILMLMGGGGLSQHLLVLRTQIF